MGHLGVFQVTLLVKRNKQTNKKKNKKQKNLPTNAGDVRDTIQFLGLEDPLKEGMATHFSILD